jgi:hypothetical protein
MVKRVTIATTVAAAMAAFLAGPGAGAASADFVCPVLPVSDQAKEVQLDRDHFITIGGGDTSILPGHAGKELTSPVDVPEGATNLNGDGTPPGTHASPGDPYYTAIWNN